MKPDPTQPIFVPPLSGTVLDFLAVTHKLTSEQTGGTCCVFEATFDPGVGNRERAFADFGGPSNDPAAGSLL